MHVSNRLLIVLGFLGATFFGCSDKSLNQDTAKVDVAFKIVADAKSDFAAVASTAEVKISADGMPTLTQPLTVTSSGISGTITGIVAGPNRKFEVFVYDAANKLCYYGSAVGEVTVGGTANIAMTLYRTNGEGNAVINGSIQGNNTPPTVSITSPANNAQFTLGNTIQLTAAAADADGSVSSVTFYSGSTLIATDNSAPFSCNYTPSAAGAYTLTAVATDNAGSSTTSSAVSVVVVSGTVTLVYEAENAALTTSAAKNTNHNGYSGTGFVDGFYYSTTAKVVFTVNVPSAGTYTLTTRYSAGNGTSSNTGLYINNTKIKNITCNGTANWETWADENETVTLNAGSNTIDYKTEISSGSCINIDKITITGSAVTSHTITYNLDGGTNSASNPPSYTSSSATITLAAPSKTGYTFGGWYDNSGFTGTAVTSIPAGSTGNKSFWAKWIVEVYTITYNLNSGTNNASNPASYSFTSATITLAAPSRTGFAFGGWYDNSGFTGTAISTIPSGSTGDKVFWAKWTIVGFTITYNLYGGTNSASNPASYTSTSATITLAAPSKTGCVFGGWFDNSGFTGTAITSIPTGSTGDKVFYARWTIINYTITYNLNGGTNNASNPTSYNASSATIALAAPTRSCNTFGGWYDNASFSGTAITSIPSGSTGDKTFYAKWSPALYIATHPSNTSMCAGSGSAIMSISAPGATTYQWYSVSGGALVESKYFVGVHSSSLTIQGYPASGTETFYCIAQNNAGCSAQSNNATLTINPFLYIATQPSNASMCAGSGSATMSISAPGATSYQWYSVSGGALVESKYFVGVHSSSLTIQGYPASGTETFYCIAQNNTGCSAQSNNATLTINPLPAVNEIWNSSWYNQQGVGGNPNNNFWVQVDPPAGTTMYIKVTNTAEPQFAGTRTYTGTSWPEICSATYGVAMPAGTITVEYWTIDNSTACQSFHSTWTNPSWAQ
jgi:uncharacterized repeat protein (TIGR02543 family)